MYIYIYIYREREMFVSLSLYMLYIYIYTHIERAILYRMARVMARHLSACCVQCASFTSRDT